MKITLALLAALAAPLAAAAQKAPLATAPKASQPGYVIQGKVGALNKPAIAYLTYQLNGKRFLDSTYLRGGAFIFRGRVNGPQEAHIRVRHDGKPADPTVRETFDALAFFIENTTIKLVAKDSINNAQISGSPTNADNAQLTAYLRPYYVKLEDLNREYGAKTATEKRDTAYLHTLDTRAKRYQRDAAQAKLSYARAHPASYMSLVALNSTLSNEADAVVSEQVYSQLSPAVRAADLAAPTVKRIQALKNTQEGLPAPDFTLTDANGKPVKLSDFRGKYVLLDFWASWCGPCRRENPNLVKAYAAYKDKGFTILGVSLDKPTDREKWLKAIETDGLPWTQVSDLKYWDSEVARLYDVKAIPMNFLIDREGRIVGKYLRGDALNARLAKLLDK